LGVVGRRLASDPFDDDPPTRAIQQRSLQPCPALGSLALLNKLTTDLQLVNRDLDSSEREHRPRIPHSTFRIRMSLAPFFLKSRLG
jgi:hypothetical protein